MSQKRARALSVALGLSLWTGCGGGAYVIDRTVGGEVRGGPFVPPYAYEHYMRGELALAHGDARLAVNEFELARSGADDDPLLCARIATARRLAGDLAGARAVIEEGLALDPESEAVLLAAGELAEASGDLPLAQARYEEALQIAPRSLVAVTSLVALLDRTGDRERSARVLAEHAGTARVEAALAAALAEGDAARAMALLRRSHVSRRTRVRAARALLALSRPVLADEVLAPLREEVPNDSDERSVRIAAAVALHDHAGAEGLLAIPIEGDVGELLGDARAFLGLGMPEHAEEHARAALAHAPSLEGEVVLARALLAEGRFAEAAELASRVPSGASASDEAAAVLAEALAGAGLPALADEARR